MQVTKKHFLAASGVVAAAAILIMFSPRRAEGQYASPVKVMNTSSAPAIGSVIDEPGRIPYYSAGFIPSGSESALVVLGAVPAGHRLVITGITGQVPVGGNDPVQIQVQTGSQNVGPIFAAPAVNSFAGYYSYFNAPTIAFYVDAGQTPQIDVLDLSDIAIRAGGYVSVSGYMLDCSAAPCAPIAQ